MKYIFFILLSLTLVSCASQRDREPSSVDEGSDVSRGINTDYYFTR